MTNYRLRGKAGSYNLMDTFSEKREIWDFYPAIRACKPVAFPAAAGNYGVLAEAQGTTFSKDETSTYNHTVPIHATLVVEQVSIPPALSSVKFLKALPCFTATIAPAQPLRGTVTNPETKRQIEIDLDCDSATVYLIPAPALLQALWKQYQVNLFSLDAMLDAVFHIAVGGVDWEATQKELAHKAFGHEEPVALGDYLRDMPPLVPNSDYAKEGKPPARFVGEAAEYYPLQAVYNLVAFLELVKAGDLKIPYPSTDCLIYFPEPEQEKAFVRMLDTWEAPTSPLLPLEPHKRYGKVADDIRELFRYRHEINTVGGKRRALVDEAFSLWMTKDNAVDVYVKENPPSRQGALAEFRKLYLKECETKERALPIYADLTRWAAKQKETILKTVRDKESVSIQLVEAKEALKERSFIALPNNMGKLPAHFAAIPAGLENGLELATDMRGQAILRVRRKGLELGNGKTTEEHTPFTMPLIGDESEKKTLAAQAGLLFGPNGPRWLVPQGLVAASKLYYDSGGYQSPDLVRRIYLNRWIDTIRPMQVERFKLKGRGAAFGHEHKPLELFNALWGVLSSLTYDNPSIPKGYPNWDTVKGFFVILGDGSDSDGVYVDVMLNPKLHKFVIGDGAPYLVTNTKAMFSYDRGSLDYAPAAQMWVETLARNNMMKTDTTTLSTGGGDGFTRLALAHGFGLQLGANEGPKHLLKRFNRILDNLADSGVLAEWKTDGRDKTGGDAFGVKILLNMHEDYRKAYNLTRLQTKDKELDKRLEVPFAVPKKAPSTFAPPAPKKRGRPPKAKA